MKKVLLCALFLLTAVSASAATTTASEKNNKHLELSFVGGWCEIKIYNGNGVLIAYSYTYENSEAACKRKGLTMLMEAP